MTGPVFWSAEKNRTVKRKTSTEHERCPLQPVCTPPAGRPRPALTGCWSRNTISTAADVQGGAWSAGGATGLWAKPRLGHLLSHRCVWPWNRPFTTLSLPFLTSKIKAAVVSLDPKAKPAWTQTPPLPLTSAARSAGPRSLHFLSRKTRIRTPSPHRVSCSKPCAQARNSCLLL